MDPEDELMSDISSAPDAEFDDENDFDEGTQDSDAGSLGEGRPPPDCP